MSRYVALVRGINVGGGNTRVPMGVLKEIFGELGCSEVSTYINSGNVVFTASKVPTAASIEKRIFEETGVPARVIVLTGEKLRRIADAMPFEGDESRLLVSFMGEVPTVELPADIEPEQIHLGAEAVYQWMPAGVSQSKLKPSFWKQFPPETTRRNIRTVRKLLDLL